MGAALKFKNPYTPKQAGEVGRLKVVQGPEKGSVFVLTSAQAVFGRGEEADVVILDRKASRRHGLLQWTGQAWQVSDMGSSNGIIVNGKNVKNSNVGSGDTITFGETTFEVMFPDVGTRALMTSAKPIELIHAERLALEVQQKRVQSLADRGEAAKVAQGVLASLGGLFSDRKTLLYAVGAIVAFYMLNSKDAPPPKEMTQAEIKGAETASKAAKEARNLAAFLPKASRTASDDPTRTADTMYKAGFREYREKNYLRAKIQFDTVLQIQPSHLLAQRYRDESLRAIREDAVKLLKLGQAEKKNLRLANARAQFEAVLRMLERDQATDEVLSKKFQEAKVHLDCVNLLITAKNKGDDVADAQKKCDEALSKSTEQQPAGGQS